jgi:hypothetical protein
MTRIFLDIPEVSGKLLKEIVPRLSRIAILGIQGPVSSARAQTDAGWQRLANNWQQQLFAMATGTLRSPFPKQNLKHYPQHDLAGRYRRPTCDALACNSREKE